MLKDYIGSKQICFDLSKWSSIFEQLARIYKTSQKGVQQPGPKCQRHLTQNYVR